MAIGCLSILPPYLTANISCREHLIIIWVPTSGTTIETSRNHFLGVQLCVQKRGLLLFGTLVDQHHQPGEKLPRNTGVCSLMMYFAGADIEQTVAPVLCFLLSKEIGKRVSSTHWLHYPLLARGSSPTRLLLQPEMLAPNPIVRHLRRSRLILFHSHSA